MTSIKLKRFVKLGFLKRLGRDLLARLFACFQKQLDANGLTLPPPATDDTTFFHGLLALLLKPEKLPPELLDALVAIDDMSGPHGLHAMETSAHWPALRECLRAESTAEDIAAQVWLSAPKLLAEFHNALRFTRLSTFQLASHPGAATGPFEPSDKLAIANLTLALDAWFRVNSRGDETTRIAVYPMRGEFWYLIRHGDLFRRAPKVERQNTEILHFRPERDDVVVYSPARDELRVNARTKGECELYFQEFGRHLRGQADYFSNRNTYTLEPLRAIGAEALGAGEIEEITEVQLRELEVAFEDKTRRVITRSERGTLAPGPKLIPGDAWLARAIFELQFAGSVRFFPVEIRVPNTLKVSRRCDPQVVQRWLERSCFHRNPANGTAGSAREAASTEVSVFG